MGKKKLTPEQEAEQQIEKVRKELSDVCNVAGWGVIEKSGYSQYTAVIQIQSILKTFDKLLQTERNYVILQDGGVISRIEDEAHYFNADALETICKEVRKNPYFGSLNFGEGNRIKGFLSATEIYRNLVKDGIYSDLKGVKGKEADVDRINFIKERIEKEAFSKYI